MNNDQNFFLKMMNVFTSLLYNSVTVSDAITMMLLTSVYTYTM